MEARPVMRRYGDIRHALRWMFAGTDDLRRDPLRQALQHSSAERRVVARARLVELAFARWWRWQGEDDQKAGKAFDVLTEAMVSMRAALREEEAVRPRLKRR